MGRLSLVVCLKTDFMKIAVSGKGGVGKTLLVSLLSRKFADAGHSVLAIDADPDANLAASLGFPNPNQITPISEMADLIEERTGARPGETGSFFKLNPKVDDLPEQLSVEHEGIRLMVMGRIKRGGTGCYCAEGVLLQALLTHLMLRHNEVILLDMEAGIEHLTRGTAKSVDRLIVVVEPGRRSLETAGRIRDLAKDIGLERIALVGNKIRTASQQDFLMQSLPDMEFLAFLPYDQALTGADLKDLPIHTASKAVNEEVDKVYLSLISASKVATTPTS